MVLRRSGPWTLSVLALLRHLEREGFAAAPRVVEPGLDDLGRELLSFIEGECVHPGPWAHPEALFALGMMLADLHRATATFLPPPDARWRPWFGRDLGASKKVFGHGEPAPWNIVARGGKPVALIDWETAGPMDPMVELAQAAWLNAQCHDDDVAAMNGLPDLETRARFVRAIAEGYGLARAARLDLVTVMIDFAVHAAAWEAIEGEVTPVGGDPKAAWAMAWRVRGAGMMLRHRSVFQDALA